MITSISEISLQNLSQTQLSPRSPRSKIFRKPDNYRSRFVQDKEKKFKSNAQQFIGFYSPKHKQDDQSQFDAYQLNSLKNPETKTIRNQRSLTHINKANCSNSQGELIENKRKQNSISNSSGKSVNDRRISRLQLQLKALNYENNRLKSENQFLISQNESYKNQLSKLRKNGINNAKTNDEESINKLKQTIQVLQNQVKGLREQLLQLEVIKQSKSNLQSFIKTLQEVNIQQRQQIFNQNKLQKYQDIQLRTLKKQRVITDANKKLHNQYLSVDADNKRLRKMVYDLQNRLKSSTLFDLTPDVSQKNDSFLLDENS